MAIDEDVPPGFEPVEDVPPGFEPEASDTPPGFEPEPESEAAPAPTSSVGSDAAGRLAADLDARDQAENDRLANMFKDAFAWRPIQNLDREAQVKALSRDANIDENTARASFDKLEGLWEASKRDPATFRRENPEQAALFLRKPETARVVLKDPEVSKLVKVFRAIKGVVFPEVSSRNRTLAPPVPEQFKSEAKDEDKAFNAEAEASKAPGYVPEKVAQVENAGTRYLENAGAAERAVIIAAQRGKEAAAGLEISRMGKDLMLSRMGQPGSGDWLDSARGAAQLAEIREKQRANVPLALGESGNEQLLTDSVNGLVSSFDVGGEALKTVGAWGVVGGAIGAGMGAVTTKSPQGAFAGGLKGVAVVGGIGAAKGTWDLEAGDFYLQAITERTDDGRLLTNEEATAGAVVYGAIATGIELGEWAYVTGPIRDLFSKGGKAAVKAEFRALVKRDPAFRALLRKAMPAIIGVMRGAAAEGGEETLQSASQDAVNYLMRSIAARELQKGQVVDVEKAIAAGGSALAPGALLGGVTHMTKVGLEQVRRDNEVLADDHVAGLADAAENSPSAAAYPEEIATLVAQASGASGKPVTHLYVRTEGVVRYLQSQNVDPEAAAAQMLGEDGNRVLQQAVAAGEKFVEVPTATYLEKWGKSGVARALLDETTTDPAYMTRREREERKAETEGGEAEVLERNAPPAKDEARDAAIDEAIERYAEELAAIPVKTAGASAKVARDILRRVAKTTPELLNPERLELRARPAFDDTGFDFSAGPADDPLAMARQTVEAYRSPEKRKAGQKWLDYQDGKIPYPEDVPDDVKKQLAEDGAWNPDDPWEWDDRGVSIVGKVVGGKRDPKRAYRGGGKQPAALRALRLPDLAYAERYGSYEQPAVDGPAASRVLTEHFNSLKDDARDRSFFEDPTTGALNERAFKRLDPAGRQVAVISVEGVKSDNTRFGHEGGNQVYRAAARALVPHAPEVAKVGGDFVAYVQDQAELDRILANANTTGETQGHMLTGSVGADLKTARAANNAAKRAAEEANPPLRAKRGEVPFGARARTAAMEGGKVTGVGISDALRAGRGAIGDQEAFDETFIDGPTGLLTKDAWDVLRATKPKAFVGTVDLNGISELNSLLGEEQVDAVIHAFGNILREEGAADFDGTHVSGDEYMLQGDDQAALEAWLDKAFTRAAESVVEFDFEDGSGLDLRGLIFGRGVGKTVDDAEHALNADKSRLADEGLRGDGVTARRLAPRTQANGEQRTETAGGEAGARERQSGLAGERQRYLGRPQVDRGAAPHMLFQSKKEDLDSAPGAMPTAKQSLRAIEALLVWREWMAENSRAEALDDKDVDAELVDKRRAARRGQNLYFNDARAAEATLENKYAAALRAIDGNEVDANDPRSVRAELVEQRALGRNMARALIALRESPINEQALEVLERKYRDDSARFFDGLSLLSDDARGILRDAGPDPTWPTIGAASDNALAQRGEEVAQIPEPPAEAEESRKHLEEWVNRIQESPTRLFQSDPEAAEKQAELERAVRDTLDGKPVDRAALEGLQRYFAGKEDPKGPRGATDFFTQGLKKIHTTLLAEHADMSTVPHELTHTLFEQMIEVVRRGIAQPRVATDLTTLLQWGGLKAGTVTEWDALTNEGRKDIHEKVAKAFEAYLMEGKAPAAALIGLFTRMKLWLLDIYRDIRKLGGAPPKAVADVFDRLLATEDELKAERAKVGRRPMWSNPTEAGMTPEQWVAYLADQAEAFAMVNVRAEQRALKDRSRATEGWWKEKERELREEALAEYETLPARQAVVKMRDQGIKLALSEVRKVVGEAGAKKVPTKADGGLHPNDAVEMLMSTPEPGQLPVQLFATGEALLQAVAALPPRAQWAKNTAATRMAEQFPDILDARTEMRAEVQKGLHGDYDFKWLKREWDALRRRAGLQPIPLESVRGAARKLVDARRIGRLDVGQTLAAERAAANRAVEAAAEQNFAAAHIAKEQQLLNMFLWRELSDAREERDAFLARAQKAAKVASRAALGRASPTYRGGVDLLLETFELKEREEHEIPLPSLADVVRAMEADGATVGMDEDVLERLLAKPKSWKSLSLSEMRAIDAGLRNIQGAARTKATALVDGKRLDKDDVALAIVAEARRNLESKGKRDPEALTPAQKVAKGWNMYSGALLRPETMLSEMVGAGDLDSMVHKAMVKPFLDARAHEAALYKEHLKPVLEAWAKLPASVRKTFNDPIDGAALFPNHTEGTEGNIEAPRLRHQLLMMALHNGTVSNWERLSQGRGITEQQMRAALDLLTKEEMDWVQSVWDAFDSTWPKARDLEERDSGLAPPKLEHRAVVTRHGTYRGGYIPAVYTSDERAGQRQEANAVNDLLDASFTRPGTARSHLKRRVEGFSGILSLSPEVLPRAFSQVLHDIAFREAVKSVGGLLLWSKPQGDGSILTMQSVLRDRLGEYRAGTLLQWVKDVGQMRGQEAIQGVAGIVKAARWVKTNTVFAVLGYSIPTFLGDLTAVAQAVPRTDLRSSHLASGVAGTMWRPWALPEQAEAKSGDLKARRTQTQRDLRKQIDELTLTGPLSRGPLRFLKEHAFDFAEWTDKMVSTAIWQGRYEQGIADGESEARAIEAADAAVRRTLPSHSVVDLPALLRDRSYLGAITMFQGYWLTQWNGVAAITQPMMRPGESGKWLKVKLGARVLAYLTAGTVLAELFSGRGPEDDEGLVQWYARKLLTGTMSMFPGGGADLAGALDTYVLDKQHNPRQQGIAGAMLATGKAIADAANDDKEGDVRVKAALRGLGPWTGIPANQLGRTGGYVFDVLEGDTTVQTPFGAGSGLIYGERENQPANLLKLLDEAAQ